MPSFAVGRYCCWLLVLFTGLSSWALFGVSCYSYIAHEASYGDAEAVCQAKHPNAHLASVQSVAENTFLASLQDSSGLKPHPAWLGGKSQVHPHALPPHEKWRAFHPEEPSLFNIDCCGYFKSMHLVCLPPLLCCMCCGHVCWLA